MGSRIDATPKALAHRILRVNKEDLTVLREVKCWHRYIEGHTSNTRSTNARSRQELLQWQLKNHACGTVPTRWFAYMTARKPLRYMDGQLPDMQLSGLSSIVPDGRSNLDLQRLSANVSRTEL